MRAHGYGMEALIEVGRRHVADERRQRHRGEDLARGPASLFEEFKQFGKDRSRKAEGTGLGLALTKRLVELHGGQIWSTATRTTGQGFPAD